MKTLFLFAILFLTMTANLAAQNKCLTDEESRKIIESISTTKNVSENKKLRKELIAMRDEREKLDTKVAFDLEKNQNLIPEINRLGEKHLLRVCQIFKENGWITRETVGDDGFNALTFLITTNRSINLQRELLPVLSEAAKKGFVKNALLADLVDNIRVGSGLPQIFGTQATIRKDLIYLYPLLNEEKVEEWRKMYDLPPLAVQIRRLEERYFLPVLKSQKAPSPPTSSRKPDDKNSDISALGITDEETEVLKIDTKIVNLNVRLLTQDLKVPAALNLSKEDFTILENGEPQEVAFFSTVEQPFDLVLLLDFSGSTQEKKGLIKRAAQRFVEAVRSTDRIAVVAFTDEIKTISDLTDDKAALAQKIKGIDMDGGSAIWDSLSFVYENIIKKQSAGRRSAVVFMTDGEDGSLQKTFADVMETVRRGDTTIFSIYIDNGGYSSEWSQKFRRKSQQTLAMLAEESGGQFYKVDNIKDLTGFYEQIANELGKIYSVGYEPKNETRDGGWRDLTVKIKSRPDLIVKTRRGYYAN